MSNNENTMFKTGDLVIGSTDPGKSVYSATGAKLIDDGVSVYGNQRDLDGQRNEFLRSVARNGGVALTTKAGKASKKKPNKKTSPQNYTSIDSSPTFFTEFEDTHSLIGNEEKAQFSVRFENDFGKMKARVEAILEHDMAYMLIFKDEDAMVFEPKVGELLVLHTPTKQRVEVYYPGVTFDSPDGIKKFMILFKVPEENQE